MVENSEIKTLNDICKEAKVQGKLLGKNLTDLYDLFGQRFTKALEALKENELRSIFLSQVAKPSGL